MKRQELEQYMEEHYIADSDTPWVSYPDYRVFRHRDNQKWFAIIMNVPKEKLGLEEEGSLDIVNFKCDPNLVGSLLSEPGFFPAYHMNKEMWISVALDSSAPQEKILMLLEMSYQLTEKKHR